MLPVHQGLQHHCSKVYSTCLAFTPAGEQRLLVQLRLDGEGTVWTHTSNTLAQNTHVLEWPLTAVVRKATQIHTNLQHTKNGSISKSSQGAHMHMEKSCWPANLHLACYGCLTLLLGLFATRTFSATHRSYGLYMYAFSQTTGST